MSEVDEDGNKAANKNKMSKRNTIKTSSSSALQIIASDENECRYFQLMNVIELRNRHTGFAIAWVPCFADTPDSYPYGMTK
jgi:hypothetical protein